MFYTQSIVRRRDFSRARRPRRALRALEQLEIRSMLAADQTFFQQSALVSDQAGVALIHDPGLINAWGISLASFGGTFWVPSNGGDVSDLYVGDVGGGPLVKASLTVSIPEGSPTGTVFNPTGDFVVSAGGVSAPSIFIFASETGHITGWHPAVPPPPPSSNAQIGASVEGAVFTGLAIASNDDGNFLYAADFAGGEILVFDGQFDPVTLAGSFDDPKIPASYAPFNVQAIGGEIYVTYAKQDAGNPGQAKGNGAGFVNVFDTEGNLQRRLISGNHLHSPWGLALAPADFGDFGGALLVGNFGDGRINAYDPTTGKHLGALRGADGKTIEIDGLRGLAFGNGVSAGDSDALYFAAGPDGGAHGLFGSLRVIADSSGPSAAAGAAVTLRVAGVSAAVGLPAPPQPTSSLAPTANVSLPSATVIVDASAQTTISRLQAVQGAADEHGAAVDLLLAEGGLLTLEEIFEARHSG